MTEYEKRDNSGILFKNDRKDSDRHPDYKGTATIGGDDFWMSAWIKRGQKGAFMTFSFQPKDERRPEKKERKPEAQPETNFDEDDDIPF